MTVTAQTSQQNRFYNYALWLAVLTIFYNLVEGLISVYFGAQDEALTLFGFGVDSFIEVLSGIVILAAEFILQYKGDINIAVQNLRVQCEF